MKETNKEIIENKPEVEKPIKYEFKSQVLSTGTGSWDKVTQITVIDPSKLINGVFLTIQGTISGCGLCIISGTSGYSYYNLEKLKAIGEAIKQFVSNKALMTQSKGCVLATLGCAESGRDKFLLDMGFIKINTFDNLAHYSAFNIKDTQSIYALNISRDEVK